MKSRVNRYWIAILLLYAGRPQAQPVSYSPYFHDFSYAYFQVAGRAGDYYWVEKEKRPGRASSRKENAHGTPSFFDVYDYRLNRIAERAGEPLPENTVKEYFVAGKTSFDQLLLVSEGQQTSLFVKRFSADGQADFPLRPVGCLPFREDGTAFILMRSAGGSRLALISFEFRTESAPRLHEILFDQDWNILYQGAIDDTDLTQPCIQDDFISFPAEDFDNLPVKLTDSGDWFMSSASGNSHDYRFFHFLPNGHFSSRKIRLSSYYGMEDISLTVDNENGGASVGILSGFRRTSLKQLQVVHYSMEGERFDFDSAYFFNTLGGNLKNKNLVRESLIGLPGQGYMFFKEYGRENTEEQTVTDPETWDAAYLLAGLTVGGQTLLPVNKPGFVRNSGLRCYQSEFNRGDLSMFYFPTGAGDSAWNGVIHESQTTELNWPSLSYLVLPEKDKLSFVYNSFTGTANYATTTMLDRQGNQTGGSIIFWKFNRQLNFQHARRMAAQEVAIPYLDQPGFAVIRL
jgi:hypothetical protein